MTQNTIKDIERESIILTLNVCDIAEWVHRSNIEWTHTSKKKIPIDSIWKPHIKLNWREKKYFIRFYRQYFRIYHSFKQQAVALELVIWSQLIFWLIYEYTYISAADWAVAMSGTNYFIGLLRESYIGSHICINEGGPLHSKDPGPNARFPQL